MFTTYYNLKKMPFEKSIRKDELFKSQAFSEFSSRMEFIKKTRGIFLLTGSPGVGKTTALRAFIEELKPEFYKTVYLPLSSVSPCDFYYQLNNALGGYGFRFKSKCFSSIQELILNFATVKKQIPVLVFDEIHFLRNENLYELQMLLNFNLDSLDPVIVVLSGHSLMRDRFLMSNLASINQRLRIKFDFHSLSKQETFLYIQHQLKLAGGEPSLFNDNAIDAIFNLSSGIIRIINNISTKALLLGTSLRKDIITEEIIYDVSSEL